MLALRSESRKIIGRLLVKTFDKSQICNGNEDQSVSKKSLSCFRARSQSFTCLKELATGVVKIDKFIANMAEGEAVQCVASVSKLAALEDVGRARPSSVTLELALSPSYKNHTCDAETITEVCSGGDLPEVEIISLLEEQIPRYKLRADTLTEFAGYENQDWFVPSPALKVEDVDLKLSPDQIRETLNYFILCSNRVSQMTKTYNDIEAVTRLLEEKERDLELTARIGKELLAHNTKLETNVVSLESELKSAQEKITQLQHELIKKTELIQILTNDVDDSGSENGTPTGLRCINMEFMQKKIRSLEDENESLKSEFDRIASDTNDCEAKEQKLVQDIAMQLATVNMDIDTIGDELERQKDENRLQHEQIISLTAKLQDAEMRLHKFTMENEEVTGMLQITKETQNSLAAELAEYKEKYAEVLGLLQDTKEQLRRQRRRGMPVARGGALFPSLCSNNIPQPDSLQSELENSLYSEISIDSGIVNDKIPPFKRVFETVRCASRASSFEGSTIGGPTGIGAGTMCPTRSSLGNTMTSTLASSGHPRMSSYQHLSKYSHSSFGSSLGYPSLDSTGQSDSESMHTDSEDCYPAAAQPGIPGVPGAADLEAALRRLTPAEVLSRRAAFSSGGSYGAGYGYDGMRTPPAFLPFGCRTPDSIMSTGSSGLSGHSNTWKLPEKLQIVKPIEGSQTLHQWSQLATPTLSGLLDDRPGVKIRGGRALEDMGLETYTLSDLEEDDAEYSNPGKRFETSGCVYTYTTSTVLHPDEVASVTDSVRGSRVASVCPSEHPSAPPTPRVLSRRNSCSTFSTTLGLAKMLNERGIKAATPSCLNTPSGEHSFTPTATPCNSPDGTPPPSRSSSPPRSNPLGLPSFLTSGADLIRRTFGADDRPPVRRSKRNSKLALSRSDKKALTGIRLVEKIERIGLESIMASTTSSLPPYALPGALYTRRNMTSPMAQLTSLKGSVSSTSSSSASSTVSSIDSAEQLTEKTANNAKQRISHNKPPLAPRSQRERTPTSQLGIPGKPGSGQLNRRLEQLSTRQNQRRQAAGGGLTRPDLGTVAPPNGPKAQITEPQQQQSLAASTLGTISSLLFGRKGGLL